MLTPTRLSRANALLADQHARLSAIIASPAPPEVRSLARHYLGKVRTWQAHPAATRDLALGMMGGNGYAPAIDDVCRQAEFHIGRARRIAQTHFHASRAADLAVAG